MASGSPEVPASAPAGALQPSPATSIPSTTAQAHRRLCRLLELRTLRDLLASASRVMRGSIQDDRPGQQCAATADAADRRRT
ncbi:hypothetical protein GCM10017557_50850 [Streptomyces aurantiacus]|uniref:Uncharacterized protein n=1 Tax=Streptomyces aurantiacus TaxID=47760 RepID=A0A7G1P8P0_9ACTN|nr:hypothetical protein GCM10017557_50850 [Streptomyces aurantiacus]